MNARGNLYKTIQPVVGRCEELMVRATLPGHVHRRLASSGYLKAFMPDAGQIVVRLAQPHSTATIADDAFPLNASYSKWFDFEFHPGHDDILGVLTDGFLNLHRIPLEPNGNSNSKFAQSDLIASIVDGQQLRFHPTIESSVLLYGESMTDLTWLDLEAKATVAELKLQGGTKSVSFDYTGRKVAADQWTDSGILIGFCDLRQRSISATSTPITDYLTNTSLALQFLDGHSESPYLIASYLSRRKYNVVSLFDVRKLTSSVGCDIEVGHTRTKPSTIYRPMFDPDTGLTYLVLQDQRTIIHLTNASTSFTPFNQPSTVLPEAILSAEMTSKRSLDTTKGEIDRLYVLSTSGLSEVSYQVSRKSIYTFPTGLYPDTMSPYTSLNEADLESDFVAKSKLKWVSLNPSVSTVKDRFRFHQSFASLCLASEKCETKESNEKEEPKKKQLDQSEGEILPTRAQALPKPSLKPKPKTVPCTADPLQASLDTFKYVQGFVHGRLYLNLLQTSYPANVDCFRVTPNLAFFLQSATGNQLAFVGLEAATEDKHRRFAHSHIHCAQSITDFALDPFHPEARVAIGLTSGSIQIYTLSKSILTRVDQSVVVEQPEMVLSPSRIDFKAHFKTSNVTAVHFAPFVVDLLAAAVGRSVFVWNLTNGDEVLKMDLDVDAIQTMAWNSGRPEATQLAAIGDRELTVFDTPSGQVVFHATLPNPYIQCRLVWVQGGRAILVSVVERSFKRKLYLYQLDRCAASDPITLELDCGSPSLLVPYHYDETSSIVYLSTRGDNTIYLFQVLPDQLKPLQHFSPAGSQHQCLAFLPIQHCQVTKCEIATGFRLTFDSIESLRFTVPRTDLEYFHDELYPPVVDRLHPLLTVSEWMDGVRKTPLLVSLAPDSMQAYSTVRELLQKERAEKRERDKKERQRQQMFDAQSGDQLLLMAERFQVMELSAKQHQQTLFDQMSNLIHNREKTSEKKNGDNNDDADDDEDDAWVD